MSKETTVAAAAPDEGKAQPAATEKPAKKVEVKVVKSTSFPNERGGGSTTVEEMSDGTCKETCTNGRRVQIVTRHPYLPPRLVRAVANAGK